ncbi:hypothetical protein [Candidatus Thiodictyon syntrophicum]|jgi:hypothetical protein|uniref:DUF4124 domain-containing protein n=1 Tax=Candidatus Thiodictyon syntrophicum TaxID=1166950 RepID=A0A2K8U846_9GAMM|nr:hypothetical protein [Candidatus Thiodictyon syntrophicum]AUB81724.1 hypothetical protein THSYN_12640 [Candidatus Thiodictyon syntrophicum]
MNTRSTGLALLVIGVALALPQAANAISRQCRNNDPNCIILSTEAPKGIPEAFVPKEAEGAPAAPVPTDEDLLNLEPKPAEQRT